MPRKRAPKGNGTVRQRSDGRWEARAPVGINPGTGKTKFAYHYAKTEAEAAKWLRKTTAGVDAGVFAEASKLTLRSWLDIWLAEYTGHLKETTLALYERHAKKIIAPALGAVKLSALTAPAVQKFINSLQKGDRPLAPKSIQNVHGVLHSALQQAVELDYLKANHATACKLPRVEKPPIKPIVDDDLNRFLDAIKDHENEREFIVCLFAGLRQAELLALTWDCVDFDKGTIFLYRQLQLHKGEYIFTSLKNDKTRQVTPAKFVMDILQEQRRTQAGWRLKAGELWHDGGVVFTDAIGGHLKRNTIYHRYKRVVASIGLPNARFHDTRHTYAINSIRSGVDIKTVQENLGHHTAAFTLDVYGHATEQMKRDAADKMDTFYNGIKKR